MHTTEDLLDDLDVSTKEKAEATVKNLAQAIKNKDAKTGELVEDLKALRQELAEVKAANAAAKADEVKGGSERSFLLTKGMLAGLTAEARKAAPEGALQEGSLILRGYLDQETGSYVPGLLDAPRKVYSGGNEIGERTWVSEWQRDLAVAITQRNMVFAVMRAHQKHPHTPKSNAKILRILDKAPASIKSAPGFEAFRKAFVDSSGYGAEWIIDLGLPMVEMDPRLTGSIEGLFRVHDMATSTELLPFLTTGLRPYKHGAASGDDPAQFTSSSVATDQRTISATGMDVRVQIDVDAAEDAIIPALPMLQEAIVRALAWGMEDCIINGDTGTHQDTGLASWDIRSMWGTSGLGGSGDHRRTFIGLRARAADVTNTANGGSVQTYAGALSLLGSLDAPHGMSAGTVFITNTEYLINKILGWSEYQTMYSVGQIASLLSGNVAAIAGKRLVLSDFVDKMYNASGIYDNSTKTKSVLICANTDRFWVTRRMSNMVELDKDITRGVYNLVARNRKGFFTPDSATRKNVGVHYNLYGVS